MGLLNFEAIKKAGAVVRDVHVEAWGGAVRLAKLGAKHKITLAKLYAALPKDADGTPAKDSTELLEFVVALLSHSIIGDKGEALFPGSAGRDFLDRTDPDVLLSLAQEALALNGFVAGDDQAGDAEKN